MPELRIALHHGFDDDTVLITVDGAQVFRREGVSTDMRVSLAAQHVMTVDEGPVEVEVSLPAKGLTASETLSVTGDLSLGVSIEGDEIHFRQSSQRFGYA
jgi:hypothetical protein